MSGRCAAAPRPGCDGSPTPRACRSRLRDQSDVPWVCTSVCLPWRDLRTSQAGYARRMRKHLLTTVVFGLVVAARATPARADVGLGLFLGEPTGLDLKVGLSYRTVLDIVLGFTRLSNNADGYGHVTYLVTPVVAQGDAVSVPIRVGIGAALFGTRNDL